MADDLQSVTVSAKKEKDSGSGGGGGGGSTRKPGGSAPRSGGGGRGGGSSSSSGSIASQPNTGPVGETVDLDELQQQKLDEITITSTIPLPGGDLLQLGNPRGLLAFGNALTPSFKPQPLPGIDRSPSLGAPPGEKFVGPEPEKLPEVKVEGKKPTTPGSPPRSLTPGAFAAFTRGVLGWGFWLLTKPGDLNLGEQRRIDAARRAELSQLLLPVVPSVVRLPEPIAEVIVRSARLSDRAAARVARGVRNDTSPRMSRVGVGFQPTPNSFLYPRPQKARNKFPITSEVTFGTNPRSLVEPSPGPPRTVPKTRTPVVPGFPAPGVPVPGLPVPSPGVGLITPVVPIVQPIGTLPQFQPGRVNDCTCTKTAQKRKKRSPRAECWKGTYVESALGLQKTRREKVPC